VELGPTTLQLKAVQMASEDAEEVKICVDILSQGFVESFVDFFELCEFHEEKPNDDDGRVDLSFTKEKLTCAESAHRRKDLAKEFRELEDLANMLRESGRLVQAVQYFRRCVDVAKLMNCSKLLKRALLEVGLVTKQIPGQTTRAIETLEAYLQLVKGDDEAEKVARTHLGRVLLKRVDELETNATRENLEAVVSLLQNCVRFSTLDNNKAEAAECYLRLGRALNRLERQKEACKVLIESLEFFETSEEYLSLKGETCVQLAQAHLSLQGQDRGIKFLNEALRIAQKDGNRVMEASASRTLGAVHLSKGNHEEAVQHFRKNFELVAQDRSIPVGQIDLARILLGVSLKSLRKERLFELVQGDDFFQLLKFKSMQ